MAMLTSAFHTFGATGNREDLTNLISMITPREAPVYDMMAVAPVAGTFHEWQCDVLPAPNADNAQLEGEEWAADALTPTTRLGNRTVISTKEFAITETQEVVSKAGRTSEVSRETIKAMAALKRDFEAMLLFYGTAASAGAGSTTVPRRMSNVHYWTVNVTGNTGYSGIAAGVDPSSDLTGTTITEAAFNTILQDLWDEGANPSQVYVNGGLKRLISGWGTSTSRVHDGSKKIMNVVDVYEGDFSTVELIKDRHAFSSLGYILDPSMWRKCFLIPLGQVEIARTGLAHKKMIRQEWTIECRNPTGNGLFISSP